MEIATQPKPEDKQEKPYEIFVFKGSLEEARSIFGDDLEIINPDRGLKQIRGEYMDPGILESYSESAKEYYAKSKYRLDKNLRKMGACGIIRATLVDMWSKDYGIHYYDGIPVCRVTKI